MRVVRDVTEQIRQGLRFQRDALYALQEAAEDYIVGIFRDANLAAKHANRVTIMEKDMQLVKMLRKDPVLEKL